MKMNSKEKMLIGMNEIIMHLNNEDAITAWLVGAVPDGADENEIKEMANDSETFYYCASLFLDIMKSKEVYEDGLYVGRKVVDCNSRKVG